MLPPVFELYCHPPVRFIAVAIPQLQSHQRTRAIHIWRVAHQRNRLAEIRDGFLMIAERFPSLPALIQSVDGGADRDGVAEFVERALHIPALAVHVTARH